MIGRVIHDRYRVQSLAAVGDRWRVYRAEQSVLGRTVAIKVLDVDPARQVPDRQLERFMLETARASRLTSPTTIAIFDYGRTHDGHHFVVMEDVDGVTLADCLEREGRLSILPAVTIVGQVCLSLREAHALGVVHGNIEPSNIVLVDGHQDQVKVLDFELTARRSGHRAPGYMAPESLDDRADSRADIYSVGAVLYRSLTGRVPFERKSASGLRAAAHDRAAAIDPQLGVPGAIERIIMACLEHDPERRPSIEDVLYALQVGILELHGAAQGDPARAAPVRAATANAGSSAAVERRAESSPAEPGWSARSVVKSVAAAAVLFAVGAAVSLTVRFALSDGGVEGPAPPAAPTERAAPAAGSTGAAPPAAPDSPAPASAAAPEAARSPVGAGAPAATHDAGSSAAGEADERRPRQRGPGRKREPSPDRPVRSRERVPEGYKESPY